MSGHKIVMYTEAWGMAGVESFVMNMLRSLDLQRWKVTLYSTWSWTDVYDEELARLGVRHEILFVKSCPNLLVRTVQGLKHFDALLESNFSDIAYLNIMNGMGLAYAWVAKRRGISVRIAHSHNSMFGDGSRAIKMFVHKVGKKVFGRYPTMRLACSTDAGEYLFGKRQFKVVNNGVSVDRFRFNEGRRKRIRDELGIRADALVVGSIGRIAYQKNPLFQIELFAACKKLATSAFFIMIGSGDLAGDVKRLASNLGLDGSVAFISFTDEPEAYYSAFDVYIAPSRFEGMPVSLVEAQCAGVPCVVSDTISCEVDCTDLVSRVSLDCSAEHWAQVVCAVGGTSRVRDSYAQSVEMSGCSLSSMADQIELCLSQVGELPQDIAVPQSSVA